MSSYTCIQYALKEHTAVITLCRPECLNALNVTLLREVKSAMREARRNDRARVIILTGAPRSDGRPCFSVGDDLKEIAQGMTESLRLGLELTNMIDDSLKPVIAVVDGVCSTGAVELALACDLRLVGEHAQISDWHLKKLGSGVGGWGASTRWTRTVGLQRAKDIILRGRVIDGAEAYRIGFAAHVFASESLWSEAMAVAREISGMDPAGVRLTLAHLDRVEDMTRDQAIRFGQVLPGWLGVSGRVAQFAQDFTKNDDPTEPR